MPDAPAGNGRAARGDEPPQDGLNPRRPAEAPPAAAGAPPGPRPAPTSPGSNGRRHRHGHRHRRFDATRAIAIGGLAIGAALLFAVIELNWPPAPETGAVDASPSVASRSAVSSGPPVTVGPTPGLDGSPAPAGSPHPVVANRITIASLGIDLPIVEGDGVDAPLGKVSHYPTTSWPGGGSNTYLYAHARDGNFIKLWDARPGDAITLTLVDGSQRHYVVTEVRPKVAWNDLSGLDPTPTEQLTLQTCTSNQYTSPRFVVIAVPEQ